MLIKCPVCDCNISEYAYKCPKCGELNTNKNFFSSIDVIEEEYECKYFSYMSTFLENEKKRKFKYKKNLITFFILIVAILISVLVYLGITKYIHEKEWNEQIKSDSSKFLVLTDMLGIEVIDNRLTVSQDAKNYIDNGITLFGDITGKIKPGSFSEHISYIEFQANVDIDSKKHELIVNELDEIYGNYDSHKEWYYEDIYTWESNQYEIVLHIYKDNYEKFTIEWND